MKVNNTRTRRGLIKRARHIGNVAELKSLKIDWDRNGLDYEMTVYDNEMNIRKSQIIKGFKSTTAALHSGFDFFENYIAQV
jgi:hypothetical protein